MSDLTEMAVTIEAACEKQGWGSEDTFTPNIIMVVAGEEGYRPRLLPVDQEMWNQAPSVGGMLRILGRMLTEREDDFTKALRHAIAHVRPVALILHTEGWSLTLPDEASRNVAFKREIHKHPERKECRIINGVLIDNGDRVGVMRVRDGEPRVLEGQELQGDVPDGLEKMAEAFKSAMENERCGGPVAGYMENAIRKILDEDG